MSVLSQAVSTVTQGAQQLLGDGTTINTPGQNPNAQTASNNDTANAQLLDPSIAGDLSSYSSGTLKPGQAAAVTSAEQQQTAAVRQQAASMGISNSTIEQSQEQQVQNQGLVMTQQFLQGNFSDALNALGVEGNLYSSVMNYGTGQQNIQLNSEVAQAQQDSSFMSNLMNLGMAGAQMYAMSPAGVATPGAFPGGGDAAVAGQSALDDAGLTGGEFDMGAGIGTMAGEAAPVALA